jgi:hypothetical protein
LWHEAQAPWAFIGPVGKVVFDLKLAHHDAELTLDEFAVQAVGQGLTATFPINP